MDENYKEALRRIEECRKSNDNELDLSGYDLWEIPEEISTLNNLEYLYLSNNNLKIIPENIFKLNNLIYLDLSSNSLKKTPYQLLKLNNLIHINLSNNSFKTFPENISELEKLTSLDLSTNHFTTIPESIYKLVNLEKLSLDKIPFKKVPPSILKLYNLTNLSLGRNQLTSLPKNINNLKKLTSLSLWNNQLKDFPENILELNGLTKLDLWNNELTEIPKNISKLNKLIELDLGDNQLKEIPQNISKLESLTQLNLSGNQLKTIPEDIHKLHNLNKLDLSDNKLEKIPQKFHNLINLTELDLRGNLFHISEEIRKLSQSEQVQEILKWQEAKQKKTLRPIHEAKAIFIGQSNYGKTHLIELLKKGKINRTITTTHGIERSSITVKYPDKEIRLNLWDLGGQEFMRSTHQFFFSERTLYVLVTLARTERQDLNHWLKLADQLGKKAPVLVVINKVDLDEHDLDRKSIQRDYPSIVGFVRTTIEDCNEITSKKAIVNLFNSIRDIINDKQKMPSVFELRRPEWFLVKEQLEKLEVKGKDYISYEEYEQLENVKKLDPEEQKRALKLLDILGTVVSFINDPRLSDTNVINPQWIMDGVYAILNDSTIKDDNKGCLHINDLENILDRKKFPKSKHSYLLNLLHKFNLCYPAKNDRDIYFIPDLFEDIEPEINWDSSKAMHFRYNYYDFPPDSFITRFIVEKHQDIIEENRWKSGVYISNGSCKAKVYQGFKENIIHIEIIGNPNECRRYLYAIREVFRELHIPFPDMKIDEEVTYKKQWINYKTLEKHEEKEKVFYNVDLDEDLPVTNILNGYSTKKERKNNRKEYKEELRELIKEEIQEIKDNTKTIKRNIIAVKQLVNFGLTESTKIHYPNVFTLKPKQIRVDEESNLHSIYELQLFCSHTKCIHPVGKPYDIKIPKQWVKDIAPYLNNLVQGLQNAIPLLAASAYATLGLTALGAHKHTVSTTKTYLGKLKNIGETTDVRAYQERSANEAEMQTIQQILDTNDPKKKWMQLLQKVTTNSEVLWVCPHHAEDYT